MKKLFISFSILLPWLVSGQDKQKEDTLVGDSLSITVRSVITVATKNEQPLWITSNQAGLFSDNFNNGLLFGGGTFHKPLTEKFSLNLGFSSAMRTAGSTDFQRGGSAFLHEYFAELTYGKAYFQAGAKSVAISQFGGDLSSGSLSQSLNARPIPRLTFGLDYFDFPFTQGYIQLRGEFSHGWLEKDRTVSNPWLHQKFAHIKLGNKLPVNLEVGLTHNAMWGGTANGVESKFILSDYWNVITGGLTDPSTTNVGSGDTFVFGFHTGTIDLAINVETKKFQGTFYIQKPWEDSEQISRHSMFVKWWDNRDGLFGANIQTNLPWLNNINIEYIQTKFQGGPGLPDPPPFVDDIAEQDPDGCLHNNCEPYGRRENYYNNFIYNDGWSYYNRILGTPLFTHQTRIVNLLGDQELGDVYGRNTIYNNRVEGMHLGLSGQVSSRTDFIVKYTFTKNFGNYFAQYGRGYNEDFTGWSREGQPYYFDGGVNQNYLMFQVVHRMRKSPLQIEVATGADFGGINESLGIMIGLSYNYVQRFTRNK